MSATTVPHDGLYKQFFSHAPMVEALLRGFVHEDWVRHIDFATLEKTNGQYVSEELLQRSDDVIWRVRLSPPDGRSEWLYLYLLIEFQNRPDRWMALRLLAYLCLLYQDLIKSGQVRRGKKLPPVFPVLIYNGKPRWRASLEVANLIAAPASLSRWIPRFRHHLLDEGRVPGDELAGKPDNLLAHLIALEAAEPGSPVIVQTSKALARHFRHRRGPEYDSLRRVFKVFYGRSIFPRRGDSRVAEAQLPDDFDEIAAMYTTRLQEWEARKSREWRQEGQQAEAIRMLSRQLTLRFGELPAWAQARLEGATLTQLEGWADAVLTAPDLQEVIGPQP